MSPCLGASTTFLPTGELAAARAKFLAEHPAVAKIIQPNTMAQVPLIRLGTSPVVKAPSIARVANQPTIWGNVVNSSAWTGRYNGHGIYSFHPSNPVTLDLLRKGDTAETMTGNGGAVRIGNKYHLLNWAIGLNGIEGVFYTYNTDTWKLESATPLYNAGLIATDLAYDRINNVTYGAFYRNDLTGFEIATIDYSGQEPVKHTIGQIPLMVVALGIDSHGNLYGICEDGVLYSFDKETASQTKIGDTGIKVGGNNGVSQQTGEFDMHTDIFYWASVDLYGNYKLYSVDMTTAHVTEIADLPDRSQILNLQVMAPAAADKAPNFLSDYTVEYVGGNVTGKVSFTLPTDTYDGTPITEDLTYTISINGEIKETGKAAPGSHVEKNVRGAQGESAIEAWVTNDAGDSPIESITLWIGQDVPVITSVTYTASENNSTIEWAIAETGAHGGYVGFPTYKIVRMPDNYVVAAHATGNSITDVIPDTESNTKYYYTVTPFNGDLQGDAVSSNFNVVGPGIECPYLETLDTKEALDEFEIIDANKDGYTWEYYRKSSWDPETYDPIYDGMARSINDWDYDLNHDDWLLTPEIKLEAGKEYQLSFTAGSTSAFDNADYLTVAYGEGIDVSKYTTIIPAYMPAWKMTDKEVTFTAGKTIKGRIGFHRTTTYEISGVMDIDNIRVICLGGTGAPAAPTDLAVTPDEQGRLSAKVEFKAPSLTKGGQELKELTKIEVYVDKECVKTFDNPTVGQAYDCNVSVSGHGNHTISVGAVNNEGAGQQSSATEFIGEDKPGRFNAWFEDGTDCIRIVWEAPAKGANGLRFIPENLEYDVYQTDGNYNNLGMLASGISGLKFEIPYDMDKGEQGGIYAAVNAVNGAGSSTTYLDTPLIIGRPYDCPIEEHFDYNSGYQYDFSTDMSIGMGQGTSSDGDNCCLIWLASTDKVADKDFKSLKISLAKLESPRLSFDYKFDEGNSIEVWIMTPDMKEQKMASFDEFSHDNEWHTAVVDLSEFKSERYIRYTLRFHNIYTNNSISFMYADNLRIMEGREHNLTPELKLPDRKVRAGENADILVNVINNGTLDCGEYSLTVYADGREIGTSDGSGISYSKYDTHHFVLPVTLGNTDGIEIKAVIDYPEDQYTDDNTTTGTLEIQAPKVSAPENLSGELNSGVSLKWDAPTKFYTEEILEDFESYQPWTITNFGEWIAVDVDKAPVQGVSDVDFPNENAPQAFTIFNPATIGMPATNTEGFPYSGYQYLACFAADVNYAEHNDDWLISPLLSGEAQDISFWAKELMTRFGAEKLEVLVSATDREISDFTLVKSFELNNADAWDQYVVSLPEGSLYFALRVVTADGYMCMIDDIRFIAGSCHEITGYNIYRNNSLIGSTGASVLLYHDAEGRETDRYNVTAVYATGEESAYSNTVQLREESLHVTTAESLFPTDIYGIDGRLVRREARNFDGLLPGIYIAKGRKIVIK